MQQALKEMDIKTGEKISLRNEELLANLTDNEINEFFSP